MSLDDDDDDDECLDLMKYKSWKCRQKKCYFFTIYFQTWVACACGWCVCALCTCVLRLTAHSWTKMTITSWITNTITCFPMATQTQVCLCVCMYVCVSTCLVCLPVPLCIQLLLALVFDLAGVAIVSKGKLHLFIVTAGHANATVSHRCISAQTVHFFISYIIIHSKRILEAD